MSMLDYPEAYSMDHLMDVLEANSGTPERFGTDNLERIIDIAKARADARDEDSRLDADNVECLIGTDWQSFAANEFGYSGGKMNKWAIGTLNMPASMGRNATLFENTQVIQQDWLETGDKRKTQLEEYVDEDFDQGGRGDFWIPRGAQDYIVIVQLSPELYHDDATVADAM